MNSAPFPLYYPVTCHTDHVSEGTVFVAIQGMKEDGVAYIPKAIAQGARKIVLDENAQLPESMNHLIAAHQIDVVRVDNTRKALARLSAQAHGFPAQKLKIIGITGTKGKTTTTFLLEHLLKTAGYKTALLSTVKNRIASTDLQTQLTTQQPDYLHTFFNQCVKDGVQIVVMEVAAQALSLHRVDGIMFDAALFTNFSQEHAEFYPTHEEYFSAKKSILNHLKPTAPLFVNGHDPRSAALANEYPHAFTFGSCQGKAQSHGTLVSSSLEGLVFEFRGEQDPTSWTGRVPALMGDFNLSNILGAIAAAQHFDVSNEHIIQGLATFEGVPGRLNRHPLPNGASAIIDYAHNPSSFEAILSTLRTLSSHLIVVFGAGGDRDPIKRPLMGAIAARHGDISIITTDNPRSEDPGSICEQIYAGIPDDARHKVFVELDRERAIIKAYRLSHPHSIIALLGKGPDEYQLIKGKKYYFSEATILRSLR